jgi:hypothetical protein
LLLREFHPAEPAGRKVVGVFNKMNRRPPMVAVRPATTNALRGDQEICRSMTEGSHNGLEDWPAARQDYKSF